MSNSKVSGPVVGRAVRTWVVMLAGCTAILAVGGAIGLATGGMPMDQPAMMRMPWHSTAVAAVALLLLVAVPMTVSAVLAQRDHPMWGRSAVLAGALMVGWIAVEIAIIRELSWLQAIFAVIGVVVLWLGLRRIEQV